MCLRVAFGGKEEEEEEGRKGMMLLIVYLVLVDFEVGVCFTHAHRDRDYSRLK